MTDHVFIEPSQAKARDFARWCLAQDPKIQTASSTGFNVPVELYPSVPSEVLEGAYVDGFPYGRASVQPEPVAPVEHPATAITDAYLAAVESGATHDEALEVARSVPTGTVKRVVSADETAPKRTARRTRTGKGTA